MSSVRLQSPSLVATQRAKTESQVATSSDGFFRDAWRNGETGRSRRKQPIGEGLQDGFGKRDSGGTWNALQVIGDFFLEVHSRYMPVSSVSSHNHQFVLYVFLG